MGPVFYDLHRKDPRDGLYSNRAIFSPAVPFFRDSDCSLQKPWCAAVITCPAVNAGVALERGVCRSTIAKEMTARIRLVLAMALAHRQRRLVLGAFGCGVFKNSPIDVARTFSQCLKDPAFKGQFDHIVFAIPDDTARVFEAEFGGDAESSTGGYEEKSTQEEYTHMDEEFPSLSAGVQQESRANGTIKQGKRWRKTLAYSKRATSEYADDD